jgi:hypothetical protein
MEMKFKEWCKVMDSEDGEFAKLSPYKKYELYKKRKATGSLENPKSKNVIFSESDLKQLMGMNRDRYERRGGAIRRK